MGVLNVTPDSFSDGGKFVNLDVALKHALQMIEEGASIIDVGGESTRPNAAIISEQEELDRVIPVIEKLSDQSDVTISVDTSKPEVMREAAKQGASLINDVRALQEPYALQTAAKLNVSVCLMHMQGSPQSMQDNPSYDDVVAEIKDFLSQRIAATLEVGVKKENIIIDPGFCFGKTLEHNLTLLNRLEAFRELDYPLLVGVSRKSMVAKVLDLPPEQRIYASIALAVLAVDKGAAIVRTHDVRPTLEAIKMTHAVMTEGTTHER